MDELHLENPFNLLESPKDLRQRICPSEDLNWTTLHQSLQKGQSLCLSYEDRGPLHAVMLDVIIRLCENEIVPAALKSFIRTVKKFVDNQIASLKSSRASDSECGRKLSFAFYLCLHAAKECIRITAQPEKEGRDLDLAEASNLLLQLATQVISFIRLSKISTVDKRNWKQILLAMVAQMVSVCDQVLAAFCSAHV